MYSEHVYQYIFIRIPTENTATGLFSIGDLHTLSK